MPGRKRNKNPLLAAAMLTPTITGALIPRSERKRQSSRRESKAIVPYRPPSSELLTRVRNMRSAAQSAVTTVLPAPVAAGMLMRGAQYQFGTAPVKNGATGVRLSGRQIWGVVNAGGTPLTSAVIQTISGATVSGLSFDPDDVKTMPPPIVTLAQIFGRYCLRKARVVYTPQSATSDTHALAFYVNTDASFVLSSAAPNSVISILEQSNSTAGPVWSMLSIDVPCDDEMRYTYQSVADSSLSVAEGRQDHAFGLGAASNTALTASTTVGIIHIEYTIDFYEVVTQANEASLRRLELQAAMLRKKLKPVEPRATSVRDEEKATISSPEGDDPQGRLPSSWSVVHALPDRRLVLSEPPTPPRTRVQSSKS